VTRRSASAMMQNLTPWAEQYADSRREPRCRDNSFSWRSSSGTPPQGSDLQIWSAGSSVPLSDRAQFTGNKAAASRRTPKSRGFHPGPEAPFPPFAPVDAAVQKAAGSIPDQPPLPAQSRFSHTRKTCRGTHFLLTGGLT
jgi:hypothetical protein